MTELERQALKVYKHYKRFCKYTDDNKIHGCRNILRILMDGVPPETLIASIDNYRSEHSQRDVKYLLSAHRFFAYCGPNGVPEWAEYQPGAFDRWTEEPEKAPESPSEASKPPEVFLDPEESRRRMAGLMERLKGEGE